MSTEKSRQTTLQANRLKKFFKPSKYPISTFVLVYNAAGPINPEAQQ